MLFLKQGDNQRSIDGHFRRRLSPTGDRTFSRLVDQITGDGWLLSDSADVGQVSYAIEMREVWTWHDGARLSGSEVTVLLSNHSIDPHRWKDQRLTLVLWDDLRISGFISEDGTQFVRTTASPESPRAPAFEHGPGAMSYQRCQARPSGFVTTRSRRPSGRTTTTARRSITGLSSTRRVQLDGAQVPIAARWDCPTPCITPRDQDRPVGCRWAAWWRTTSVVDVAIDLRDGGEP